MDFANISAGAALLISVLGCVFTNLQVVSKIKEINFLHVSSILEKLEKDAETIGQKQQTVLNAVRDCKRDPTKATTDLRDAYVLLGDYIVAYSNYLEKLMIFSSFMPHPKKIIRTYKDECSEMLNFYASVHHDIFNPENVSREEVLPMDYPMIASLVQFYKSISLLPGRFALFGFIRRYFPEKSLGWKIYRSFF